MITKHAKIYYEKLPSGVSNEEFDSWVDELTAINPENPVLHKVGWGYEPDSEHLAKVKHYGRVGGISSKPKVNDEYVPSKGEVLSGKFDGGSLELVYEEGVLVQGITRGNGEEGLDVTENIRLNKTIPIALPTKYTGNVVGEFVLSDESMSDNFADAIAQRNIPNGYLSRNTFSEEECNKFDFVAYKITKANLNLGYDTRTHIFDILLSLGFLVASYAVADGTLSYGDYFEILRKISGNTYPLDGIVSQDNKVQMFNGSIQYLEEKAYKTVTETKEVTIEYIDWNLTRTGKLVPTAVFKPIELSGAEVKRALAHNAKYVSESGLGKGAIIEVIRSGQVIPYIYNVVSPSEDAMPTTCPECGAYLEWNGVHLECPSDACSKKSSLGIKRWITTVAPVDNLGSSLINSLVEKFDLSEVKHLYEDRFNFNELSEIEGVGSAKISIVVEMMKALYQPKPLNYYLVALNIPNLSWESAYKLVKACPALEGLFTHGGGLLPIVVDTIESTKGVNKNAKSALVDNWSRILELREFITLASFEEFYKEEDKVEVNPEDDTRVKLCITGKLTQFKTKKVLYESLSDKVVESDVKVCEYLLITRHGEEPSSKMKTAEKLNNSTRKNNPIKLVTEEELLGLL